MIIKYKICAGDSIVSLAKKFRVAPCAILAANAISEKNLLIEGQVIKMPVNSYSFLEDYYTEYVVQPTDTLDTISAKFGIDRTKIEKDNKINAVFIGQKILIYI